MWKDDEIRELCKKLAPAIGKDKADRLYKLYLVEDLKGRQGMALEIELVAERYLRKKGSLKEPILLEPPSLEDSAGLFLLGDVVYNDEKLHKLYLMPGDLRRHCMITGQTGTGKSNLVSLLLLGLLRFRVPWLLIDFKRSARKILSYKGALPGLDVPVSNPFSVDDILLYTIGREGISPLHWNPFRPPPGTDPMSWISIIAEVLEKSHISGPGVMFHLQNIYSALFKKFDITSESTWFPNFYDGLAALDSIKVSQRMLNWKQTLQRILSDFTLGQSSKMFNARHPARLEELLDKPVIFEVDLGLSRQQRLFLSELLLRWIHLFRLHQGSMHGSDETLKHVIFLDELHNHFPKTKIERDAHDILETIFRECREHGQGVAGISQQGLPDYITGNSAVQAYFGMQHANEIRTAKLSLFMDDKEQEYLNRIRVGEMIVKIKDRMENPCVIRVPLVPLESGKVTDEWLRKRHANLPFLQPETAKNGERDRFYQGVNNNAQKGKNASAERLLVDVYEYPVSGMTQRYTRLGINAKYGNEFKEQLTAEEFVKPKKIFLNKEKWIMLLELTAKGRARLRESGYEAKDETEGAEHKFWKQKICEFYRSKGFIVEVEAYINGKPDLIVINGEKRIALEIETGNSDVLGNIEKNLKAGFDEIICVATNKEVEQKIREQLGVSDERVRVTSVFEFDVS